MVTFVPDELGLGGRGGHDRPDLDRTERGHRERLVRSRGGERARLTAVRGAVMRSPGTHNEPTYQTGTANTGHNGLTDLSDSVEPPVTTPTPELITPPELSRP